MRRSFFTLLLLLLATLALFAETYRGNTKSRVFHAPSCRHYDCPNCTARFASPAEAVENGYRPCGVCRPGHGGDDSQSQKSEEAYSGNTRSRKFHRGSCRYAGCANCTAKFKTRQEAIDAGYAPGGCCKP